MQIGIQEELLQLHALGLLEPLLADKTTGSHLIWATDAHAERGPSYRREREMEAADITGINADVIKTRARKALEQQSARTKQHAEVFTPRHICERMLSEADASYFGGTDPFLSKEKIPFTDAKAWQFYVDARRLEITCGEAPYLTERYDVTSGEAVPLGERLGVLDRKFRVVSENTDGEEKWLNWAFRALQATYGYEFQGDNVLLARLNLLMSFAEAYRGRFGRKPDIKSYRHAETIIVWNLWQMDGLSGTIPYCKPTEEYRQFSLFDSEDESIATEQPQCRIRDWRRDRSFTYGSLKEGGSNKMKFDFVIGNPPYQEETTDIIPQSNGQVRTKSIFHHFQMEADKIASMATILIYPGARWLHRSGKGMNQFGLEQLNDITLQQVDFYPDSSEVFQNSVAIADGITIVQKNKNKTKGGFNYVYHHKGEVVFCKMDNPGEDLIPLNPANVSIVNKTIDLIAELSLGWIHDRILSQKLFGIESDFVEKNPEKVREFLSDSELDFSHEIKLLTNDKAGKAGRAKWFVTDRNVITAGTQYLDQWKVVVSSANAGGQKRDNQLEVIDNHSAFGRSRVALACFCTEEEALNFFEYVKTYFVRFMFLMTDESLTSLGKRVPDFFDYSSNNEYLDFRQPLDEQLYQLLKLTEEEKKHIIYTVDNLRQGGRGKKGV